MTKTNTDMTKTSALDDITDTIKESLAGVYQKLAEIETNSRKMDRRLKEMEGPMKSQLRGARRKIEILEKKCHAGYFN